MEYTKAEIFENLQLIRKKITAAEKKANRPAGCVKLMAVSKFHPVQSVLDAQDAGQILFGENRVLEAKKKFEEVHKTGRQIELHIIGTLQRNKVKDAVKIADCIESVDRIEILNEIEQQCSKINKTIQILFEFHTGEETKSGFLSLDSLKKAAEYCADGHTPHIVPTGFMTMAPFTQDKDKIRKAFILMRETAENMHKEFPALLFDTLSMGMSEDFEIAIEEGATLIRIGTAIFGERNYTVT
jgi:PLP dependent protein